MSTGFDPDFTDLPGILPVFPLNDVLLLPKGRIALKIFEPRYVTMVNDAFKAGHRMMVMVQPKEMANMPTRTRGQADDSNDATDDETIFDDEFQPLTYSVGCVGRIISLQESLQQYYQIELKGIYRCILQQELYLGTAYRQFQVDFTDYKNDAELLTIDADCRQQLVRIVKSYFKQQEIDFDVQLLENLHDEVLVTSLAMVCPFSSAEKQGLLEAQGLVERAVFLLDVLKMNLTDYGTMSVQ